MSYGKPKANKPSYNGNLRKSIQHIGGQETYNNRKISLKGNAAWNTTDKNRLYYA